MEESKEDVPLPGRRLKVTVVYNGKGSAVGTSEDADAEYDTPETVLAVTSALKKICGSVSSLQVSDRLPEELKANAPQLVFNIAEGIRGRGREAEVPALLNLLNIPFTGSDETALAASLDKELCKRLVSTYGVRVPESAVIASADELDGLSLPYPLIVKPNTEGSSKGVGEACVVDCIEALHALVEKDLQTYGEPMLCERYLPGREFTVGILGNGKNARAFEPMEIIFRHNTQDKYRVYSYGVKKDYKKHIQYSCPADITDEQSDYMKRSALTAFHALGCCDFARADFRMDEEGNPYFIEINPLPGLAPGYSDYPMLAEMCGVDYNTLVCEILSVAVLRLRSEGL